MGFTPFKKGGKPAAKKKAAAKGKAPAKANPFAKGAPSGPPPAIAAGVANSGFSMQSTRKPDRTDPDNF